MSNTWSSGKNSYQFCDRCGQRYEAGELKKEIVKGRITETKVCPVCWDPDHPQLHLGETPIFDPQALRDPRRDVNRNVSNAYVVTIGAPAFPVVGTTVGCPAGVSIGHVTISIV